MATNETNNREQDTMKTTEITRAPLADTAAARTFATAGKAIFTLENSATGRRFTFKVRKNSRDAGPAFFVSVLTGSDNNSDYTYLGCIFRDGEYRHGSRSSIGRDAMSAKAFAWFWTTITRGELPASVTVWHEARCGRCGRRLTVPESVASGFGPECVRLVAAAA